MEQQNKELAEDKVLILYLLNKIFDGIKNDNLYKIVSSSKDINYFYFQELIADLMSANLICSFEQDEESFIKITTEGKNALELTKSLLPGLLKLKADTIFKEENSNIVEESSVVTEFIPKDENNYTITCKIVEQNESEPEKIEQDLIKIFPKETLKDINHLFMWLGRNTCEARNPHCDSCSVKQFCEFYKKNNQGYT